MTEERSNLRNLTKDCYGWWDYVCLKLSSCGFMVFCIPVNGSLALGLVEGLSNSLRVSNLRALSGRSVFTPAAADLNI